MLHRLRGTATLNWAMLCIVPAVALLIAGRQVYLNYRYDLSTWKGGGMGMFAGADNRMTRYAKIYIVPANDVRFPIAQLTAEQQALLGHALWFPAESSFRLLADSIKEQEWEAFGKPVTAILVDSDGSTQNGIERYLQVRPSGPRQPDSPIKWKLLIEYWKTDYDNETRTIRAKLAKSYEY